MTADARQIDVHQHLWPVALLEQLRRRTAPPMLRGWTLYTAGEPPFEVAEGDHDATRRATLDRSLGRALVSLSTPLGIEALPPAEAQPLLDAWHDGALDLPDPFLPWASAGEIDPDLDGIKGLLTSGFVGVQISATQLATPSALETVAPLLSLCEGLDRPVLVHPGPVGDRAVGAPAHQNPAWWPVVVDYPAQLQAAWWAWRAAGRSLLPRLRICFAAGAGLAPLQHERFTARGGGRFVVDRDTFVESSSHGRQGIDALSRALGIDVLVLGSDRPYADPVEPSQLDVGAAAWHAMSVVNPCRLIEGVPA